MEGYINLFEQECLFMGNGAYLLKPGYQVTIAQGEWEGRTAEIKVMEGKWILKGDNFDIHRLQGLEVKVDISKLEKLSVEK
ncbi:MAG: hypothetical protein PHC41_06065 [Lachnospiraceae bacterium]|jgi:hypothetical protein|nr:hypothetical protein [Lachnospiraceae bacterium]MDD3615776.1 hypothetical protein [Lachnospiraceae bacterium]